MNPVVAKKEKNNNWDQQTRTNSVYRIQDIHENIGKQTSDGKQGAGIGYIASRSGNTPATNELLGPLKNFQ